MMKKTLIASALLAASTGALAEISGNVALSSDYVFRGISQTDNQMAISGGFDYSPRKLVFMLAPGRPMSILTSLWRRDTTRRSSWICTAVMPVKWLAASAMTWALIMYVPGCQYG